MMNSQINIRMPANLLSRAQEYAEKNGFRTLQDFVRETIREKIYEEPRISAKELELVKKLVQASMDKGLLGTEKELFKKLKRK